MNTFDEKLESFLKTVNDLNKQNSVPKWFKPFVESIKTFAGDLTTHLANIESSLATQKAVTDGLAGDRDRLMKNIQKLEDELDDQQQYSRRNCLLIHGIKEENKENVEQKVMEIFVNKLEAGVANVDISRTHRIGRVRNDENEGKPRPIIVRFSSYRQRKKVFDSKKKLKGQRITITESLIKKDIHY